MGLGSRGKYSALLLLVAAVTCISEGQRELWQVMTKKREQRPEVDANSFERLVERGHTLAPFPLILVMASHNYLTTLLSFIERCTTCVPVWMLVVLVKVTIISTQFTTSRTSQFFEHGAALYAACLYAHSSSLGLDLNVPSSSFAKMCMYVSCLFGFPFVDLHSHLSFIH